MRIPEFLSHSSTALYYKDPEEFYVRHLSEYRSPRSPQQNFMAIGSGFDARCKNALHESLFGKGADPQFEFEAIFESQVEPHNRDWCLTASAYAFDAYKSSGAYDELLELLHQSAAPPRFEFTVKGKIGDVPFLGKPDCYFQHRNGFHLTLDWKVRGFCSKSATSPTKYFRLCRDGYALPDPKKPGEFKRSRTHGKSHDLYKPYDFHGFEIHVGWMEDGASDYADQLAAYSWLMGEPVGGEFVGCIDEIVCKPVPNEFPLLRIANQRARIRPEYQQFLFGRIQQCWSAIQSGHIFPHMSREENDERCQQLDQKAITMNIGDDYFNECTRAQYR